MFPLYRSKAERARAALQVPKTLVLSRSWNNYFHASSAIRTMTLGYNFINFQRPWEFNRFWLDSLCLTEYLQYLDMELTSALNWKSCAWRLGLTGLTLLALNPRPRVYAGRLGCLRERPTRSWFTVAVWQRTGGTSPWVYLNHLGWRFVQILNGKLSRVDTEHFPQ